MKKAVDSQKYLNENKLNVDGVKGIRLLENEEAELLTGSDSGVNDKQFVDQCLNSIARSTGGLSRATLTQDFEASYSASRAALISFHSQAENLGCYIVDDWLRSVYAIWLEDVILSGQLPIPNYPNPQDAWMHFVLNRELYCGAEFRGPAQREIDQAKQIAYWQGRRNLGAFTFEDFYNSTGTDWQAQFRQQFSEMKYLDQLIETCELKHINPLTFIHGNLDSMNPNVLRDPDDRKTTTKQTTGEAQRALEWTKTQ